jgi:hypothetical protein
VDAALRKAPKRQKYRSSIENSSSYWQSLGVAHPVPRGGEDPANLLDDAARRVAGTEPGIDDEQMSPAVQPGV